MLRFRSGTASSSSMSGPIRASNPIEKYTRTQVLNIQMLVEHYMQANESELLRVGYPTDFAIYFKARLYSVLENPSDPMGLLKHVNVVLSEIDALNFIKYQVRQIGKLDAHKVASKAQFANDLRLIHEKQAILTEDNPLATTLVKILAPLMSTENVDEAVIQAKTVHDELAQILSGEGINPDSVKREFNHLWGHLLRVAFQKCQLIDTHDLDEYSFFLGLLHALKKIFSSSLPEDLTADTLIKKDLFQNIDANAVLDAFLNYLGELVKNKKLEAAAVLHNFVATFKKVQSQETGGKYDSTLDVVFGMLMAPCLHGDLYFPEGGLGLYGKLCQPKTTKIKPGSESTAEVYFMQRVCAILISHPIFAKRFDPSLYTGYGFQEELTTSLSTSVVEAVGELERSFHKLLISRSGKGLLSPRRNHVSEKLYNEAHPNDRPLHESDLLQAISSGNSSSSASPILTPSPSVTPSVSLSSSPSMASLATAAAPAAAAAAEQTGLAPASVKPSPKLVKTTRLRFTAETLDPDRDRIVQDHDLSVSPAYLPSRDMPTRDARGGRRGSLHLPDSQLLSPRAVAPGVLGVPVLPNALAEDSSAARKANPKSGSQM